MSISPYQPIQPGPVVPKSTAVALLLGLFLPGVGNMYASRPGKGILILICTVVAWLSILLAIGVLLVPACCIWGSWTAHNDARRWNQAHGLVS
jgi:TM2 domain-containing membrane protein YozV